ncbi:MAG: hypothetical protein AB9888_15545 [Bacteroidales bacterium]
MPNTKKRTDPSPEEKQKDHTSAIEKSRRLLADNKFVIFDTANTGVGDSDEHTKVCIVDSSGAVLLDAMVKPTDLISDKGLTLYGITDALAAKGIPFVMLHPIVQRLLNDKVVVTYYSEFDRRLLRQTCERYSLPRITASGSVCAMLLYSKYIGEWDFRMDDYKWHKLPKTDGTVVGDCKATLDLLKEIAGSAQ